MAGVPASSHGGGLPLTGGTLTGPLVLAPTAGVPLSIFGPAGSAAADANLIAVDSDTQPGVFAVTAAGEFAALIDVANGSRCVINQTGGGVAVAQAIASAPMTVGYGLDANPIASGALPTVAPVTTTPFQCSTTRDVTLVQIVTYNPTAGAAATCKVELSPDNVTYSTLITISYPPGVVFDGTVLPITLNVPAAWRVKLTTTNATLGTGTYY